MQMNLLPAVLRRELFSGSTQGWSCSRSHFVCTTYFVKLHDILRYCIFVLLFTDSIVSGGRCSTVANLAAGADCPLVALAEASEGG